MRLAVLRRVGALVAALGLVSSLGVPSALAASITVTSLADVAANDGDCTLREAITAANTDTASGAAAGECAAGSGADTITFGAAGTITLTTFLPTITSNLSIDGAGAITVSGDSVYRVFGITGGPVTLSGLVITAGDEAGGGGIDNSGTLAVTNSTISGNTADFGGGILNVGILTVTNSTISGNTVTGLGGGINNIGTLTITNSTMSGNSAGLAGAIQTIGTLTITNSTISGNTASGGAGGLRAAGTETVVNSIIAGNTVGADINFPVETVTTSIIGVPGGMTLADILVPAGLADNGGPTQTIALALVAGNPAIDTATSAVCAAAPVNGLDQRGMPRPAACDIGAYEAQPPTIAAHANVTAAVSPAAPLAVTYTPPAGTDEQGGSAAVACLPASGSSFAVGSTTVTCTATDAVGHTASGTFQVIVTAVAAPAPPSPTPTATPKPLPNAAMPSSGTDGSPAVLSIFGLVALFACVALGWGFRRGQRRG